VFGTLKPHACGLGCSQRHEYATFYCGLCKGLGDGFGQLTRAFLTYDAVFLALVADGLVAEGAAPDRCRCPLLPVTFRPTVRPDSPAVRYAAAMQMLLSDQWLADRAADGGRAARAARPLIGAKVETARAMLGELGISLADLEGFEERQQQAEALTAETPGPRSAAEPTAAALAIVFDRMALLPGVPDEGRTEAARAALGAFGRRLGSVIYLIDALDDLEKDHRGGAFNPCLLAGRRGAAKRVSWPRVEMAWGMLHDDLAALGELLPGLPLRRHRELVHSVVAVEMPRLARAAAKRAHAYARDEDARLRAARRAVGTPRRALAAAATLFVLLWVWLSSIPALARGQKRGQGPRASGAPPASASAIPTAGTPPEKWEPKLPAPPAGNAAPPANGSKGAGADPTTPAADADGGAPPGPVAPVDGGGCSKSFSDCCEGCGKPFKGCLDCCNGCKGGDCSACTKPCSTCGSCSNCGNACNCCNR
jgi:Family of unknown function (DUF5685)